MINYRSEGYKAAKALRDRLQDRDMSLSTHPILSDDNPAEYFVDQNADGLYAVLKVRFAKGSDSQIISSTTVALFDKEGQRPWAMQEGEAA